MVGTTIVVPLPVLYTNWRTALALGQRGSSHQGDRPHGEPLASLASLRRVPLRIATALFYLWCDSRRFRPEVLFVHNAILGDDEGHYPR